MALRLSEGLGISAAGSEKKCSVPPLRLTLASQSKEVARCALTKLADAWFCLPPLTKWSEATSLRTAAGPKN